MTVTAPTSHHPHATPHACVQVLLIVGTERPKGDHRLLVKADPANANNSRFDAFKFFRGGFTLSEEKTLFRLRELFCTRITAPPSSCRCCAAATTRVSYFLLDPQRCAPPR